MKKHLIVSLIAAIFAVGCADLKHVNNFSKTAVKTIISYDDIGYNFTSSYYTYTLGQNAYKLTGNIVGNTLQLPQAIIVANEPKMATDADKAITFYIKSISAYFEALTKLSDPNLVNYNFDAVRDNIKADAALKAKLGVTSDDKVDAAAKIATVFTSKLMGAYREKKIREVIIGYDGDVSKSIQTLIDIFNNALLPLIAADQALIDSKYSLILANPNVEISKKADLTKAYNDEKIKLDKHKTQITQLVEALVKIKDEHNKTATVLANSKLTAQAVKDIINQHSAEVYLIYTNIKLLTDKSN
ncbi:hypothetical protein GR160_07920 [Flavobacterium sp. Sd200]|uniref:hypothetical protein n=1 Tax=Flavobacterium sp. Sd200 TaxID=2692211 RepID=UPI00136FAC3E|nr:hypothetical protein [Flavobacterium sp. Sd200]MXN91156.1 hypothetical protein [Flavobacterium sp. Sd200]